MTAKYELVDPPERSEWQKMSEELGAAWEALPDDLPGDYDRLADAVADLVAQRDEAQRDKAHAEGLMEEAQNATPDDLREWPPASVISHLLAERCATAATMTAVEALDLVAQYGPPLTDDAPASHAAWVGYVDGLRTGIGGVE